VADDYFEIGLKLENGIIRKILDALFFIRETNLTEKAKSDFWSKLLI